MPQVRQYQAHVNRHCYEVETPRRNFDAMVLLSDAPAVLYDPCEHLTVEVEARYESCRSPISIREQTFE